MKDYKEFTFGWLIFVFVAPLYLVLTYLYVNQVGDKPLNGGSYFVITLISIVLCVLFYGLTTNVTQDAITVSFGPGLIRKRIQLKKIENVQVVKSPWYYGWGIRIIPNGILYNISGSDAVELTLKDTRRIVRIGTKDSFRLKQEIENRLR